MADERVALITGASKGIGRATADRLSRMGRRVIGLARTEPSDFPGALIKVDLLDREATTEALAKIADEHAITTVINNVGIVHGQPLEDIDRRSFDEVMDLNLWAAIECSQMALPAMREAKWGRIVNISSLTAVGVPHRTAYAAAKTALISFTRSWSLELAKDGVTVNCVAPGPTETELFNQNNPPGSESRERYVNMVPMGRVGDPDEVAAAVAFFCSDDASFVTGQTLFACGGSSIGHAPV